MRKILLLGGTGVMGGYLSLLYSKMADTDVYVTTRRKFETENNNNIHFIQGNAHSKDFLDKLARNNWDIVVDFMIYTVQELKERVSTLLNMTKVYVFLSSARVYALSDEYLTEKSERLLDVNQDKDYIFTHEYALEKAREEDILFNSKSGNWIIVRPYITYGVNRFQLGIYEKENWLYRVLNGRTLIVTEDILDKVTTLTNGQDVAKVIYNASLSQNINREVIQAASPDSYTWEEILNIYNKCLTEICGCNIKYKRVQSMGGFDEAFSRFQLKYDRLGNRKFDSKKAEEFGEVGWTPIETGIKEALKIFIENPNWLELNWKSEALMDKLVCEKTSLSEMPDMKTKLKYMVIRYTDIARIIVVMKKIKRKIWKYVINISQKQIMQ